MISIDLRQGDCLELMKDIPSKSIDLILCDLPYGTTRNKWDSVLDLDFLWEQYNRIIKEHGAILLFAQTPFDKVLGVSNLKDLRYEIIWQKTAPTGFLNAKKMPMKAHENILVFYKKLPTYNPQMTKGHPRKVSSKSSRKKVCRETPREIRSFSFQLQLLRRKSSRLRLDRAVSSQCSSFRKRPTERKLSPYSKTSCFVGVVNSNLYQRR